MKDYWLAKLISSVDVVDSRKRLQKAVYLLQQSGCPLQCEYILHYYGPYSFELANLVDKLKSSKLIEETSEQRYSVISYCSKVIEPGKKMLAMFEQSDKGKKLSREISSFIGRFKELIDEDLWILELAATVAYFHEGNWQEARRQTATFKKIKEIDDSKLEKAFTLARKFKKSA